jgi:hypothetical protein
MTSARACVHVSVDTITSTSPACSVGMRLGVVTQVSRIRFGRPNASVANRRATATSYPRWFP